MSKILDESPTDLSTWRDWLERLTVAANQLDASVIPPPLPTRRWVERLVEQIHERRDELAELAPWIEPLHIVRENAAYLPSCADAAHSFSQLLDRWSRPQSLLATADQAGADAAMIEGSSPEFAERQGS